MCGELLLTRRTPHRKDSFGKLGKAEPNVFFYISFRNIVMLQKEGIKRLIEGEYADRVFSKRMLTTMYRYGILMRVTHINGYSRTLPTCLTTMILEKLIGEEETRDLL